MPKTHTLWSWLSTQVNPHTEWWWIQQAAIDYLEYRHIDTVLQGADEGWDRAEWVDSPHFKTACILHLDLNHILIRQLWLEILADND